MIISQFTQDPQTKLSSIRFEFAKGSLKLTENDEPDIALTLKTQDGKFVSNGDTDLQNSRCVLKPLRAVVEENAVVVTLDPSTVNKFEGKPYKIELIKGSAVIENSICVVSNLRKGEYTAQNIVSHIPPRRRRIPVTNPDAASEPSGQSPQPAASRPTPSSIPIQKTIGAVAPDPKAAEARLSDRPDMPGLQAAPPPLPPARPIEKPSGSKLPLIIGGSAAAILLAAALWYFLGSGSRAEEKPAEPTAPAVEAKKEAEPSKQKEETKVEVPPAADPVKHEPVKTEPISENTPQPDPKAVVPVPEPQAPAAPVKSVREEVRSFFAAPERSVEGALTLSKKLAAETPEDQDALFRLWYFAAQGGSAEAALPYANALDPTTPQWGSIRKDADEALVFYRKAGASAQVDALLEYLGKAADAGDLQADRTLKKYKYK